MKIAEPHADIDPQTLRKAQLKMAEILDAIDSICQRHDLRYFLAYGTLLGAVRHKGFIPWDDDCDIFMPRADYEKFAEVAVAELPENMFFQIKDTDSHYKRKMPKVRLRGTKIVEFDEDENELYHQGLYVDIFIGDYYPSAALPVINFLDFLLSLRWKRKRYPKGSLRRSLYSLAIAIPSGVLGISKFVFVLLSRLWRKNDKLPYLGMEAEQATWPTLHLTAEWLPAKRDIVFEGRHFSVPNDSDALLKKCYGDYMVLPVPEDRHTHAKKIEL